ncbi:2-dehydropantoate 2-reductase (Ketopantoate reductase) (KPA reductase) (KPR) [Quaeritorhiza haematococci]|nr:2-dehydropantoate 2-reductase (Ketopantoate reductase) (KPA reductase) (KPR) [Quaeritorhiza haematococci]
MSQHQIHILGAGAIGLLTAHHLRQELRDRIKVTFLLRSQSALDAFKALNNTITVKTLQPGTAPCQTAHSTVDAELCEPATPIRHLVVTTKAPDTVRALKSIKHRLVVGREGGAGRELTETWQATGPRLDQERTVVVLFQNGVLGVYEEVLEKVFGRNGGRSGKFDIVHETRSKLTCPPASPSSLGRCQTKSDAQPQPQLPHFILGSTSQGAYRESPFTVVHTGQTGPTYFGAAPQYNHTATPELQETLSILSQLAPMNVQPLLAFPTLYTHLLVKLAVNACINPITALVGCRNGWIGEDESGGRLVRGVCEEVAALMENLCKDMRNGVGIDAETTKMVKTLTSKIRLEEAVLAVVRSTALNRSSMLADIQSGRRTEIEYITGYLVQMARERGVAFTRNEMILDLMRMKEREIMDEDALRSVL